MSERWVCAAEKSLRRFVREGALHFNVCVLPVESKLQSSSPLVLRMSAQSITVEEQVATRAELAAVPAGCVYRLREMARAALERGRAKWQEAHDARSAIEEMRGLAAAQMAARLAEEADRTSGSPDIYFRAHFNADNDEFILEAHFRGGCPIGQVRISSRALQDANDNYIRMMAGHAVHVSRGRRREQMTRWTTSAEWQREVMQQPAPPLFPPRPRGRGPAYRPPSNRDIQEARLYRAYGIEERSCQYSDGSAPVLSLYESVGPSGPTPGPERPLEFDDEPRAVADDRYDGPERFRQIDWE